MSKASLAKGTRDFGPEEMIKRNYLIQHIRAVFERYGFQPLETPSIENLSVLTGKYGDEGDQLLFKILNSGDYLKKVSPEEIEKGSLHLLPKIAEKGLRYDLTVPFARYVSMNRHALTLPFKRYQIQPVWRADRPQKGRYREFYQCDADVIGTDSLLCEAEIMLMAHEVFQNLCFKDYRIKMSNRKILSGLSHLCGAQDKETGLFVTIDKLDKIGLDAVGNELTLQGFKAEALDIILSFLQIKGDHAEVLKALKALFKGQSLAEEGIRELEQILRYVTLAGLSNPAIDLDPTLARGLGYYTGAIFEVKPTTIQMGSIAAGGRYDNLTGVFGWEGVSGVGFSFGVDRIYDTLEELGLFPNQRGNTTKVLLVAMDDEAHDHAVGILSRIRKSGISAELFPEPTKLKKQLGYADKKGIPFAILLGEQEIKEGQLTLKNLSDGSQSKFSEAELVEFLKK